MNLDFTPAPAAAPRRAQVWQHAKMEAGLILSNGEQLILAIVFPVAILVAGKVWGARFGVDYQRLAPSVLGMVLWSSGLTTLAIATGFERRYNVLERLAATPLGKDGILLGKALSIAMITFGQVAALGLLGLLMGWRPVLAPAAWLVTTVTCVVGMAAFIALGLAIAGSLRPETTLALANLLFLIGLPLGIVIPVTAFPSWAQPLVTALPTAAVGESLRAGGTGTVLWLPLGVAAVWATAAAALARKVFRWTS